MAPLSSPDSSQSRFGGGSCGASMAPLLPASGFGFDGRPHLQRLLQSSAARSEEDSSFQIQGQFGQCFLPQTPEPTSRHSCTEMQRSGNSTVEIVATDPARDPAQLGQAFPSYGHAGPAILPSLTRYHSAPSSVLADLTGMANGVINPNLELARFLSGSNIVAEAKAEPKPLDVSGNRRLNLIENQVSMAAPSMDQLGSHDNGFPAAHGHYHKPGSDGELLSQMSMDADDVPLIPSPDTLSEVGNAALQSPPSFHQKSRFIFESNTSENGVHGAPPVTDSLLRHSSSPAGFLSQLTDDYERHMVASSSGNSSEEGSYERQGDQGLLNGHAWDDNGHMTSSHLDGMPVARKRIRDLLGSSYLGSTLLDSQKADALENTMLGSFYGMPMTDSPESMYLTDKVSSDSIPCRTRAKRGCATHPRSIAERVRRTKISERMKKLQELVPHMDKQANTAEMLDEVVDYVKCLQRQVKELTENQSKCNCACGKPRDTTALSK